MALTLERGNKQFQGAFSEMWFCTESALNFGNAAVGSGTFASVDITVPGVALGDVVVGLALGVDTVDAGVVAVVTAANTVTFTLMNNSAGAIDLASTTCKFMVGRPLW